MRGGELVIGHLAVLRRPTFAPVSWGAVLGVIAEFAAKYAVRVFSCEFGLEARGRARPCRKPRMPSNWAGSTQRQWISDAMGVL